MNLGSVVGRRFAEWTSALRPVGVAAIKYRRPVVVSTQLLLVVASNYAAYWLRFDGAVPPGDWREFTQGIWPLLLLRGTTFIPFHLYDGLWRYAGLRELMDIVAAVLTSTAAALVLKASGLAFTNYSRAVFVIDALLLIAFLCGIRLLTRVMREWLRPKGERRVLIFGAGDAGEMIVRDMQRQAHGYEPIGFVDDNEAKIGHHIHGVPVLGSRIDLPRIMERQKPDEALVAMPSAPPSTIAEVVGLLRPFKMQITTLPSVRDILACRVSVSQIRELTIEDLLQRAPVDLSVDPLRDLIAGRSVIVTGAGGSIGSELSRQIASFRPSTIVLFERYENALHDLTHELLGRFGPSYVRPVIGDVTDAGRVRQVFHEFRPEIVFHAAAHKHVPLMENNPCEAVKNNILGTMTVARIAEECGVSRFMLISTDKAVNPTSVMGATKYVCEQILESMTGNSGTRFLTVRFGNVLGSNGSVLPRFLAQVRTGGPVTVTHPEIKRYFMLVSEAVQLVLHAAALGEPGMTYVLDMGEQIKLVDLARNVIRLAGYIPDKEIEISYIGLRPGEKLYEELVSANEVSMRSPVPKILRVRRPRNVRPLALASAIEKVIALAAYGDAAGVIDELRRIVPTFEREAAVAHDERQPAAKERERTRGTELRPVENRVAAGS